jgi:hypothetical protein
MYFIEHYFISRHSDWCLSVLSIEPRTVALYLHWNQTLYDTTRLDIIHYIYLYIFLNMFLFMKHTSNPLCLLIYTFNVFLSRKNTVMMFTYLAGLRRCG